MSSSEGGGILRLATDPKKTRKSKRLKQLADFWYGYRKNRAANFGLVMIGLIFMFAILAPIVAPYDPSSTKSGEPFVPPSFANLFGTDDLGRDIFSGVIFGARVSLAIGIFAATISTLVGVLIGGIAGYYGGKVDDVLMRFTESFMVLPTFVMGIVFMALWGPTFQSVVLVIGLLSWPSMARLTRAEFLSLREREFVDAVRTLGARDGTIIFGEILPNAIPPVIVNATLQVATAILFEAGLSFIGLGDPNVMSWGLMLRRSQPLLRTAWWTALFPGLGIFLTALSLNLVGDGLNESLNPRLREK
jgi:peptide/nickel transport system permease protein